MIWLRSLEARSSLGLQQGFPFSLAVFKHLSKIDFAHPVSILLGENGSGKSTVIESIALLAGLPTIGSKESGRDETLDDVRQLTLHLKLVWNRRVHRGFFFRAEDFFGFCQRLRRERAEAEQDLREIHESYVGRSELAKTLARSPHLRGIAELKATYGADLQSMSHGESFLTLFESRLVPGGLYLLDEPEAALSPTRQLALISLIQEACKEGCQFIIATHSPILMALPQAFLLSLDFTPPRQLNYDDVEHVKLYRSFLTAPERYLRHL